MKIETLLISGASTKAPIFIGCIRGLYEKKIINHKLDGIKHIITCSIGMLLSIYLLLNVPLNVLEEAIMKINFLDLLDVDSIDINSILFQNGMFDNDKITSLIQGLLKHKYNKSDLTLQELYEINPILLTVKCCNVTRGYNEYINYKTHPNLSISLLLKMTTCLPFIFKPIEYNDNLYVDGGLTGGYPIELVTSNYLGLLVIGKSDVGRIFDDLPLFNYIIDLLKVKVIDYDNYPKQYTITYKSDIGFSDFEISTKTKKDLIKLGYDKTLEHINKYKLINDLFNTLHHEDINPNEEDLTPM